MTNTKPLTPSHPIIHNTFLLPSDEWDRNAKLLRESYGINEAPWFYYSTSNMLRKYKHTPEAVQYIADLI